MRSEFIRLRIMLRTAEELYDEGAITTEEYISYIEKVEEEFNALKKKLESEELFQYLNSQLDGLTE